MAVSLNSLLHTIGENVRFRTEQEFRDFHAGVDEVTGDNPDDDAKPADANPADANPAPAKTATGRK